MRAHFTNAAYGVLDYAVYPAGMFVVAPIVLHKLGAAEYGIWTICTAVVSTGGIIASGFCDANIQRVARLHGVGEMTSLHRVVRNTMTINLALGVLIAVIAWVLTPYAAGPVAGGGQVSPHECLMSLRIASILIFARAAESAIISTQRALMHYRDTVQISIAVRLLTLSSAALLALTGKRTPSIMAATALFLILGTCLQFRCLRRWLAGPPLWPTIDSQEMRALIGFGVFSWLQALGGVIFSQCDRILLGVTLGAAVVAPYAVCVQFCQPLVGLTASGLHFLFPHLAGRTGIAQLPEFRRALRIGFACNLVVVAVGAGLLWIFGDRLIRMWAGAAVARSAAGILPLVVLGAALMGLSITGSYAMLAVGAVRTIAFLSLATRGAMLVLMWALLQHAGLRGLATARVFYGSLGLLIYLPLLRHIGAGIRRGRRDAGLTDAYDLVEGSQI